MSPWCVMQTGAARSEAHPRAQNHGGASVTGPQACQWSKRYPAEIPVRDDLPPFGENHHCHGEAGRSADEAPPQLVVALSGTSFGHRREREQDKGLRAGFVIGELSQSPPQEQIPPPTAMSRAPSMQQVLTSRLSTCPYSTSSTRVNPENAPVRSVTVNPVSLVSVTSPVNVSPATTTRTRSPAFWAKTEVKVTNSRRTVENAAVRARDDSIASSITSGWPTPPETPAVADRRTLKARSRDGRGRGCRRIVQWAGRGALPDPPSRHLSHRPHG